MNAAEQIVIARRNLAEAIERVDALDALLGIARAQLAAERRKLVKTEEVLVSIPAQPVSPPAPMIFAPMRPAA